MLLICLSCAWVSGILLGSNFYIPSALALVGLVPLSLLFFARQHRKILILTSLSLITLFAAAAYSHSRLYDVTEGDLRYYNDRGTVEIRGMVAGDPEVRDKSTRLELSATELKLDGGWQAADGTALIFVARYPAYKYGDILLLTGKLETPPQLDDFDYKGYLSRQGIYSTMLYPKIEIQERGKGFKPLVWVYSLRNRLGETIARVLPEPQASLAQAITLGIRHTLPPQLSTDFIRSGTAHLLAISGLHLSVIATLLLSTGVWLFGRRNYLYIWLAMTTIWLYALITGMHPPVVRGAIMTSLFLTAELLGRQRSAITALTFAAAIMTGVSPYILWDAAFQLSFLAMAGLIFLFPFFQGLGLMAVKATLGENGATAPLARAAIDSFSASLAAVAAIWPVVAYYFGVVSIIGPLATFLLLPALPGIIITGTLTGILGLIALSSAQITGWLTWLFLSYMIAVVGILATPSISSIEVGQLSTSLILAYYPLLAAAIWLVNNRQKLTGLVPKVTRLRTGMTVHLGRLSRLPGKWVVPPLLIAAILVSLTAASMPDDRLHVSFLDVGDGDAILIQKGNQQVLVDGGPGTQAISLALGSKMPFWDRTIDLLVLTHPHHDHLAGLVEVLQRYRVRHVLYPALDYESPLYDRWTELIEEKSVEHNIAQAGLQIDLGHGTTLKFINPQTTFLTDTESDLDNNSTALRLSTGKVSFLLTADIMRETEWELIRQRADLTSTVLKVAHHGSVSSTTPEFLAVASPEIAVISVGGDNQYGHPSPEVLDRLKERLGPENLYRTDQNGTVEFTTDGQRLWVKTER